MPSDYPPYRGPRVTLADALSAGEGPVAGRLSRKKETWRLTDGSTSVRLDAVMGELVDTGDWVAGRIARAADGSQVLEDAIVLAKRRAESPDPELPSRLPLLRGRAAVIDAARAHFSERGFLEVSTPTRVTCPGLEPHLDAFAVGDRWLITSPELHLKRMLAGGAEKVFEIARAFRDDERGPWHMPEFTLLEWYRAFEGLAAIEADCERLVLACAEAPGIEPLTALPGCDLSAPFDRTTVREALDEATGLDLAQLGERDALAAAVEKRGHRIDAGDSWDDVFFRVWIAEVEPGLGSKRPVFVHDYPASQAALARTHREDWGEVAERFELYINGVEVANAFHELNDPDEQRRRHEADRETRRAAGRDVYPLDEAFLAALEAGMPPAAGVALGLDRLAALLTGASSLESVTAFP